MRCFGSERGRFRRHRPQGKQGAGGRGYGFGSRDRYNLLDSDTVADRTELTDAETVEGDESFAPGTGGARVWDAQGHDIYYQGSIEKELPVQMKVTYKLDGKEISPEQLAGKDGKVTIRFDYDNQQYETV